MSYARMNAITFVSEQAADEVQAQYSTTAPDTFVEATLLTFVRTGPTTASLTSVYPDKAAFDRSASVRAERMQENKDKMQAVEMSEGDVALVFSRG